MHLQGVFKELQSRGPCHIISNNSKSFESASKIIVDVRSELCLKTYFCEVHMSWKFNSEKTPWSGGIFERMIRCHKKTVGNTKLSYNELLTIVTQGS